MSQAWYLFAPRNILVQMSNFFPTATQTPLDFDTVHLRNGPKYIICSKPVSRKIWKKKGTSNANSSALKVDKLIYQVGVKY